MKKIALPLLLASLLPSCSIAMAARKSGVDIDSVLTAHTREQLIVLGAQPIAAEGPTETYLIQKKQGSIARALLHGILDLGTGFLWELAGTPIESALTQQKYYSVKVTFDGAHQIQNIELCRKN